MSTKFTLRSRVQKPPAVCRKPPDPLPIGPPSIQNQIIQVFGQVLRTFGPPPLNIRGGFLLYPGAPDTVWAGSYSMVPALLTVTGTAPPPYGNWQVEIRATVSAVVVGLHTFVDVAPTHLSPLELPFLQYRDPTLGILYTVKTMT